jgi:hypothetical protein
MEGLAYLTTIRILYVNCMYMYELVCIFNVITWQANSATLNFKRV